MAGEALVPGGVLAFDAGNSKTDVALVSAEGRVLGTARGGGFEPHVVGAMAAVQGLAPLVAAAAREAGLTLGEGPLVQQISACMANADLPIEEERLAAAFEYVGWAESVYVANDTFALLRAGVDEPRGVAVVCGAGINCAGLLPDGRTARFAAVGKISGDWGGGQQLADEAFWAAARAEDGRGPATALTTALPAHYGVESVTALIEALHLGDIPVARRLEATPVLFQVAAGGDAVAADVVRFQAEEIVAMATVAMRRLGVLDEQIDVVLGGGVLTAGHPMLLETVVRLLSAAAPKAVPHVVDVPPVVGAALLGLDRTKAAPTAHVQLRAAFAPPPAA
ncbi:N-acetylglucosamine kinase-like BadF-type ATPase [Kribbella voronezhensis]|uniref:N-acetylglucosamine kinase-like BadF-type ATPase n=1 Tax=Kribbella voronezhensis TaxID=2512212 RepID=A0A4R7TA33_9ACTN|nr:BadF/BadG/BcrA/BcrD ATPase family protein [Kribbella voronezhensis]TDU88775.1 N-acetylglucosamine kinase-like BadF-type ATPase [Kribbella voronezhensis]